MASYWYGHKVSEAGLWHNEKSKRIGELDMHKFIGTTTAAAAPSVLVSFDLHTTADVVVSR